MTTKHYLLIALLIALAFGVGYCNRKDVNDIDVMNIPAETERKGVVNTDSIRKAAYLEHDNYWQPILKASERELAASKAQHKQKQEKAVHSAATFVNSGKLEDCRTALTDCQEESTAAAGTIAKADSVIVVQKAQRVNDSTEIVASHKAAQDFNVGWKKANEDNAVLTRKVKNKNKLLKIGGAIIAVLVGVVAVR